jgi:ribosomal protein S27AE
LSYFNEINIRNPRNTSVREVVSENGEFMIRTRKPDQKKLCPRCGSPMMQRENNVKYCPVCHYTEMAQKAEINIKMAEEVKKELPKIEIFQVSASGLNKVPNLESKFSYLVADRNTNTIWIWKGTQCSPGEAYKASVESTKLKSSLRLYSASIVRVEEGEEPETFPKIGAELEAMERERLKKEEEDLKHQEEMRKRKEDDALKHKEADALRQKEEEARKIKEEEAHKQKIEVERKHKEDETLRLKEEEAHKQKIEAERKHKEEEDRKQKIEAERKRKEEEDRKQKIEAERKHKEEEDRKQKIEAERKHKEEEVRKQKIEVERKRKEEETLRLKEEEERKQKEEELRLEKEQELKQKAEEEQLLAEEVARKRKEEEEHRLEEEEAHERREAEERQLKEEEERIARDEERIASESLQKPAAEVKPPPELEEESGISKDTELKEAISSLTLVRGITKEIAIKLYKVNISTIMELSLSDPENLTASGISLDTLRQVIRNAKDLLGLD